MVIFWKNSGRSLLPQMFHVQFGKLDFKWIGLKGFGWRICIGLCLVFHCKTSIRDIWNFTWILAKIFFSVGFLKVFRRFLWWWAHVQCFFELILVWKLGVRLGLSKVGTRTGFSFCHSPRKICSKCGFFEIQKKAYLRPLFYSQFFYNFFLARNAFSELFWCQTVTTNFLPLFADGHIAWIAGF